MTVAAGAQSIEHASVSIRLRPPRVAVVVPTARNWQYVAAYAIHRCTGIWGGAGFILVPHDRGQIKPELIRAAIRYDPDHVVTIGDVPLSDLLEADVCEHTLSPDNRDPAYWRENGDPKVVLSPYDRAARARLSEACSSFKIGVPSRREYHDDLRTLSAEPDRGDLRSLNYDDADTSTDPINYFDPTTRDLGLLLGERYGISSKPIPRPPTAAPGANDIRGLANQEIGRDGRNVGSFRRWTSPSSSWRHGLQGLTYVSSLGRHPMRIIVGATFHDFALSFALSRIDGLSLWLPTHWLDADSPMRYFVDEQLSSLRFNLTNTSQEVAATSVSEDLSCLVQKLEDSGISGPVDDDKSAISVDDFKGSSSDCGDGHLVLKGDYDRDLVLPVRIDSTSGKMSELANALPAITPETGALADFQGMPYWILDVDLNTSKTPTGRGVQPGILQDQTVTWPERVRSGRDGISVISSSFGFVPSGATVRQSLARPKLRFPGVLAWAQTMAEASGYSVEVSDAGRRAQLAERLWGGRERMANDVADFLNVFLEFLPQRAGRTTAERYPDGDGCLIRQEGYLSFAGVIRASDSGVPRRIDDVRKVVDRWCTAGILRRGLILRCPTCLRVQWYSISDLVDERCGHCRAMIPITIDTWGVPDDEPTWFYDLHPGIRDLFGEFGHVPLLAGRAARSEQSASVVAPELIFSRDGNREFEIDLLVASREYVGIGECKNQPTIPRDEVKRKLHALVESARLLRADEVILAAAEDGDWDLSFVEKLAERIRTTTWAAAAGPTIVLVTGLAASPRWSPYAP